MTTPYLIDTHSHLHFKAFDLDREHALDAMRAKNIWGISVGTNEVTSRLGIAFAEQHPDIFATVGYHPEHLSSSYTDEKEEADTKPYDIKNIMKLAVSSTKVVALGETGLDFFRIDADRDRGIAMKDQEQALRDHIHAAKKLNLPLVIHCRDAFEALANVLQDEQNQGNTVQGVVHCFTGSWTDAVPLLDLGLHLSFTGIITYPLKKTADPALSPVEVAKKMPIERLLVETDAPWLTPVPHRGKKNEPAYVEYVADKIAAIRGLSLAEIAKATTENAFSLFGLKEKAR